MDAVDTNDEQNPLFMKLRKLISLIVRTIFKLTN
jgi:hypothetical protein